MARVPFNTGREGSVVHFLHWRLRAILWLVLGDIKKQVEEAKREQDNKQQSFMASAPVLASCHELPQIYKL